MNDLEYNLRNLDTVYLRTNYLWKPEPGVWRLTCQVMKHMGDDPETYRLHLYHKLRDWVKFDQVTVVNEAKQHQYPPLSYIMFNITLDIQK